MISVMKKIEKRLTDTQYIFDFEVYYTPNLWTLTFSENSIVGDPDKIEFHLYPEQNESSFLTIYLL